MDSVIVIRDIQDYHVNLSIVSMIALTMEYVMMDNVYVNPISKDKIVLSINVLINVLIRENV